MQILREHNVSRAPELFGSKRTTDSINTCVYFAQFPQRCQPIFGALRRQKCRKIVNISRISARKNCAISAPNATFCVAEGCVDPSER